MLLVSVQLIYRYLQQICPYKSQARIIQEQPFIHCNIQSSSDKIHDILTIQMYCVECCGYIDSC